MGIFLYIQKYSLFLLKRVMLQGILMLAVFGVILYFVDRFIESKINN